MSIEEGKQDKLDERMNRLEELMIEVEAKLNNKLKALLSVKRSRHISAKKNHPLHFLVEKDLIESFRIEVKDNNISMGEFCRRKLRGYSQLDRIEMKIDLIKSS